MELEPLVLLFELSEFFRNIVRYSRRGVCGLFAEAEQHSVLAVDLRVTAGIICNVGHCGDVFDPDRFQAVYIHVKEDQVLEFLCIFDLVSDAYEDFSLVICYITRRHGEILCAENRGYVVHCYYAGHVGAVECSLLLGLYFS